MKRINGDRLNAQQRAEVLSAFVHRWTHENRSRYGGRCPACVQREQCGGDMIIDRRKTGGVGPDTPDSEALVPWHDYHAGLISDEQWLHDHSFYFTKDSHLAQKPIHAEPRLEVA